MHDLTCPSNFSACVANVIFLAQGTKLFQSCFVVWWIASLTIHLQLAKISRSAVGALLFPVNTLADAFRVKGMLALQHQEGLIIKADAARVFQFLIFSLFFFPQSWGEVRKIFWILNHLLYSFLSLCLTSSLQHSQVIKEQIASQQLLQHFSQLAQSSPRYLPWRLRL